MAVVASGVDEFGHARLGGIANGLEQESSRMMASLQGNEIKLVPLADAVAELRRVPTGEYERLGVLFG